MEKPDYIPISYLNALEYCPRRFWYEFVEGEMLVNAHVLAGTLRHERAHEAGRSQSGETVTLRSVYLYSETLGVAGFSDLVEEHAAELLPVEYKSGRWGRWLNDHIQLCAQALCLEERTGRPVPRGYLFYFGAQHRQEVVFTPELRARTQAAIAQANALIAAGHIPPPEQPMAKCRECSLKPLCLPEEVRRLGKTQDEGQETPVKTRTSNVKRQSDA